MCCWGAYYGGLGDTPINRISCLCNVTIATELLSYAVLAATGAQWFLFYEVRQLWPVFFVHE